MNLLNQILNRTKFKIPLKFKDFEINIYNEKDFKDLLVLYDRVFPSYLIEDLWNWKNFKNHFRNYITIIMKHKDDLIAAYSVVPKQFIVNGKKINCVKSMDTMTDKNYRGLGISTYLANLTYGYAKLKGNAYVYGFPNEIFLKLN